MLHERKRHRRRLQQPIQFAVSPWKLGLKQESQNNIDDVPPKRKRNNNTDTINFLREKSQNELGLKKEKLELKRQELEFQKEREQVNNARNEQLFDQ